LRFYNVQKVLSDQFSVTNLQILNISKLFYKAMLQGLNDEFGSLKMLPSYMNKPTRQEKGEYLTIDFGGTNLRIEVMELLGNGAYKIGKSLSIPLDNRKSGSNFTSERSTATDLFGFIACQIRELAEPHKKYFLGHTFSFPTKQTGPNSATLLKWTKELKTSGVEGQDINVLLSEALKANGIHNVFPKVIINDTVGTLLTAAYKSPHANIGSICGTGHNTCYFEPSPPTSNTPMIINIESGNFNKLQFNKYDDLLDRKSEKPGEQRLEKMVGGKYLGELVRLIVLDFVDNGILLCKCNKKLQKEIITSCSITSKDVAEIQSDNTFQLEIINYFINSRFHYSDSLLEDRKILKITADLIIKRAAKLIASTYLGILDKIDPNLKSKQIISLDGSLYGNIPLFQKYIRKSLDDALGEKSGSVIVELIKDGSGVGAAIAAAMFKYL